MRMRALAVLCLLCSTGARADDLIKFSSARPVTETLDRLQTVASKAGFTIVARIRHAENASRIGASLRPTELLIFGKAQNGTPMMVCDQRAGIDLPFRALAWEDGSGKVWLGMVDPAAFRTRYDLKPDCDRVVEGLSKTVRDLLADATAP